jgi:RNA polymerase sigma-70 factor (ECF subfamily)
MESRVTQTNKDRPDKDQRFQALVMPHLNAAFNLARWLTRSDLDAEDVTQEACLRAYKFFGSFQGEDGKTWLLAIVRNTFYSDGKRRQNQAQSESFDETLHDCLDADVCSDNPPESALMQRATQRHVWQAIEDLPLEFREMVVMRELEDLSYKQIAAIANVPVGTVMSRLARARRRLALLLAQHEKER